MNDIQSTDVFSSLGLATSRDLQKDKNTLGQEQFLELMVAQVRNQDPFKPLENGEFLSQIAQFSQVSGIQDLQNSFSQFANSLGSNQAQVYLDVFLMPFFHRSERLLKQIDI